jgi:hypothetical protein
MECAAIGVFKKANKLCLQSLLEGKEGRALHSKVRLQVTSNLMDQTLEVCHPDPNLRALLVFTDLIKGDGPRAPTMGFLHTPSVSG